MKELRRKRGQRDQAIPVGIRRRIGGERETNKSKNEKDETNNRWHCPILSAFQSGRKRRIMLRMRNRSIIDNSNLD
jgi:hypothetical protein